MSSEKKDEEELAKKIREFKSSALAWAAVAVIAILLFLGGLFVEPIVTILLSGIILGILTLYGSWVTVPTGQVGIPVLLAPFFPTIKRDGGVLAAEWEQGTWAKTYGPGTHFIWFIQLFGEFVLTETVHINEGDLGLLNANDGDPLPEGIVVSDRDFSIPDLCDGEAVLRPGRLQRGPQWVYLSPGDYPIHALNPGSKTPSAPLDFLFTVKVIKQTVVAEGKVAALISGVGPKANPDAGEIYQQLDQDGHVVTDNRPNRDSIDILANGVENRRGIVYQVRRAGPHNINTLAYKIVLVDITDETLYLNGKDWTWLAGEKKMYPYITAQTAHGFPIDMKVQIRFLVKNSVVVVARGGTFVGYVEDILLQIARQVIIATISMIDVKDLIDKRAEKQAFLEDVLRMSLAGIEEGARVMWEKMKGDHTPDQIATAIKEVWKIARHIYPGVYYKEIQILGLDIQPDFEKYPETRAYIEARTAAARQEAEQARVKAETITETLRVEFAEQEARKRHQDILIQAKFARQAAADNAAAAATMAATLNEHFGPPEGQGDRSVAYATVNPQIGPNIANSYGERFRDMGDVDRIKVETDRTTAKNTGGGGQGGGPKKGGNKGKGKKGKKGGRPTPAPPAGADDDDEDEDGGDDEE